jgi:hypothetical protein
MRIRVTVVYCLLLIPSFLLSAAIWEALAVDRLFHCSDSYGYPGDFIPFFVHSVPDDHYMVFPPVLWALWLLLVAFAFFLPAAFLFALRRVSSHLARHINRPTEEEANRLSDERQG